VRHWNALAQEALTKDPAQTEAPASS